jgi:MOSC domain-containing protein YiiM
VISVTSDRDFEGSLADVRDAPRDAGRLVLIVRRPNVDEREILAEAVLDSTVGLVGDGWSERGSSRTPDGGPNPESQVTVINTRVLRAIEPDETRWPLAGDQLYVDFDLGQEGLPPGSRIAVGSAVLVVSEQPHTGCAKFSARFGSDALRWINSPVGRELRMRGMNTRVVEGGTIRTGDSVRRV